ncbi:MAG: translation initiation factor IF-3 [Sphingomonadales bacterium]|nr:translation initiation factor IF-3 [Sphingomonadales bacterium]
MARPPKKEGPRTNQDIDAKEVRLVDHEGTNHGVVDIQRALDVAKAAGLDLVEVVAASEPPVCKVLDYGKFRFEAQKKAALARKKQKTQDVKEIKMRPNIDTHDYEVKKKAMTRFIEQGDKVKVTIRFRGREMAHQELGMKVLTRVREEMKLIAKVESHPKLEGRQMMMVIVPK